MDCKVKVLTKVYNGLPYLSEAIESVLNQTYTNFEYLNIDDTSTDDSVKCIQSYKDLLLLFLMLEGCGYYHIHYYSYCLFLEIIQMHQEPYC